MAMQKILLIAVLVTSGLTGQIAVAQEEGSDATPESRFEGRRGQWRDRGGPADIIGRMVRKLELDEAQQEDVRNIMTAARPEFESLRERGQANRLAVQSLDVDDPDYGASLQNLAAESGDIATSLTLLHGRVRSDVLAVLTPEQQAELAEMRQKRGERGRRGPRHRAD